MGQTVEHPLWKVVAKLSAEIARAEVNFGMTPLLKMRLTGHLDHAQEEESNIRARREGRRPTRVSVLK